MIMQEILNILVHIVMWSVVPLLFWLVRREESFVRSVGLFFPKGAVKDYVPWVTLFFGFTAVSQLFITPAILPAGMTTAQGYAGWGWKALVPAVSFATSTGLGEEIFWRGFLARRLAKRWANGWANFIQALLFGLLHGIIFVFVLRSETGLSVSAAQLVLASVGSTILTGFGGWILGRVTLEEAKGSILPAILIHGLGNFAVAMFEAFSFF